MITWDQVSAFGDEVEADLETQLACLTALGIRNVEFRSAWGINVVEMNDMELQRARRALDAAGVRVSAIGSPIGKTRVAEGWAKPQQQMVRAVQAASILGTSLIRVFSFYPEVGRADEQRPQVLELMAGLAGMAEAAGVTLVHENEKEIFGDTPERCLDLFQAVDSPRLKACFDIANFIQIGCADILGAWTMLEPYVEHVHVKDALPDGTVRPAGEGVGDWPEIINRLDERRYDGFLTLEPHLDGFVAGGGAERMGVAATALGRLLGVSVVPAAS